MGQFDNFLPSPGLKDSGNRAVGESIVIKKSKPKPKAAAAPAPPPPPKK
jgi:hypothetical protein